MSGTVAITLISDTEDLRGLDEYSELCGKIHVPSVLRMSIIEMLIDNTRSVEIKISKVEVLNSGRQLQPILSSQCYRSDWN